MTAEIEIIKNPTPPPQPPESWTVVLPALESDDFLVLRVALSEFKNNQYRRKDLVIRSDALHEAFSTEGPK